MITDWDDAYTNVTHIPQGTSFPEKWRVAAQAFRDALPQDVSAELDVAYGDKPRNQFDLFKPKSPKGLLIFVHGGYWMRFDRKDWSHLARGALAEGYAVAMPSYTLTPHATITGIVDEVTRAVTAIAQRVAGPIVLAGHSAGGHLATRMVCVDTHLTATVLARIKHVVSISGVHDLRPLLRTQMNSTLRISPSEADLQSPVLLQPVPETRLTCWVGADERPEFVRQSRLLANIWTGLGATTSLVEEKARHHFDVIDGLNTESLMQNVLVENVLAL
jgi:arylformamidase